VQRGCGRGDALSSTAYRLAAAICALGVLVLGMLGLAGWLFGAPALGSLGTDYACMPPTAAFILIVGVAMVLLVLQASREQRARLWGHWVGSLGRVVAGAGGIVLAGYLYGAPLLHGGQVIPVAATTGAALALLGVALVLAAGPECIPARWLSGPSARARLLRAFLPLTVAAVVGSGVLQHWASSLFPGLSEALVSVVFVLGFAVVTGLIVVRVARTLGDSLDRAEAQQRQSHEALWESEERYRRIVQTAEEGIWVIDREAKTTYVNRKMAEMLGYAPEEMAGQPLLAFMNKDQHPLARGLLDRRRQGVRETHDFLFRRKDGGDLWASLRTSPTLSDKGGYLGALAMVTDITDRRRADERVAEYQNRLRSLASRQVLTEQRERRRIAVFLHDQIGQALAVAKLRLGALREAATPEDRRRVVDEVAEVLDGVIGDTRSATFDLSPPILYELGFEAAVEWLVEKVGQEHRLRVRFESDGQPKPMAENVRIVLFLAVREVLTNIIKHAQARSASLSILREEDRLCVSIADDGRGFDAASPVWHGGGHGGFGLFSTRERLEHLGGRLEVTSAPGQGTKVTLVAPLEGPPPPVVGGSS